MSALIFTAQRDYNQSRFCLHEVIPIFNRVLCFTFQNSGNVEFESTPWPKSRRIVSVKMEGEFGLDVTFSDGTEDAYTAAELLELRPYRDLIRKPAELINEDASPKGCKRPGRVAVNWTGKGVPDACGRLWSIR
jgi:hypothetical protein